MILDLKLEILYVDNESHFITNLCFNANILQFCQFYESKMFIFHFSNFSNFYSVITDHTI